MSQGVYAYGVTREEEQEGRLECKMDECTYK